MNKTVGVKAKIDLQKGKRLVSNLEPILNDNLYFRFKHTYLPSWRKR